MVPDQPTAIKEINQLRILNALRRQPGLSRTGIVRQTNLSKATVSVIVADFIEKDLVHEVGPRIQAAATGRRPIGLELNGRAYHAIGVELTGDECIAVLTNLSGDVLSTQRTPMPTTSVPESLDVIERSVGTMMEGYDDTNLAGVAVGIPGRVDSALHTVILAENIGWRGVPLGSLLAERIGKPVMLINRTSAGALGEYWYGIAKGCDNFVYVSIDSGVGAGSIIGGRLYEGANNSAGELGHISIDPDGDLCRCGNVGCLETRAGFHALTARAKRRIKEGVSSALFERTEGNLELITAAMVIDAAASGDNLAIEVIGEAAEYLGIGLATVINLFNPALVVLDGELLVLGPLFLEPVRKAVNRHAFSISLTAVQVVPSALGHQAAAIGASSLVIDQFFTSPGKSRG